MKTETSDLNVKNLCSRKLLELYATANSNTAGLTAIVEELQQRRHYLEQLSTLYPAEPQQARQHH